MCKKDQRAFIYEKVEEPQQKVYTFPFCYCLLRNWYEFSAAHSTVWKYEWREKYFSSKHQQHRYENKLSVIPIGLCIGCTYHHLGLVSDFGAYCVDKIFHFVKRFWLPLLALNPFYTQMEVKNKSLQHSFQCCGFFDKWSCEDNSSLSTRSELLYWCSKSLTFHIH